MDDYTTNTRITDRQDTSSDPGDFGPLLESLQLSYIRNGHYYQVGELTPVCGWIIDLSVVESQVDPLLRQVLPILIREQVPFKIPQSSEVAKALLAGLLGYSDIGKIVSIFPGSPGKARQIAALLVSQLHAWHGPAIPAHYPLGGIVYTRFGGYAPVEIAGDDGRLSVFNQDARGNWMPETSPIPFRLPRGLTWPYERLCKYRKLKDKRFLRGRYLLTHALKRDAKGRVMRAFDLRRWWDIRMCIVKEGIRHMSSDSSGRDIADRLQWQHTLHHSLARTIPLPKVIDYFEDRGNVYFVMEYIEGMAMSEVINTIYQSTHWSSLGVDRQRLLTTHFLSILDMLINLHETGYYHRDLSPRNFILTHGGRIVCIDLELVYDFRQHQPDPPFQLGTAGYAAPEQLRSEPPTAAQDVYGIGGLLIRFFTSLSPKHYQWDDPDRMIRQLSFLCGSKAMARLISRCLHIDPMERPTLTYIRNEIRFLRRATAYKSPRPLQYPSEGECRTTILRAIACLGTLKMSTPEGIWFSRVIRPQRYLNNESLETGYYTGFRQGVGGILYFLSLARMAGYAVAPALPQLQTGWQYLHDNCLLSGSGLQPGLYNGAASTSLAYIKAVEAGFIQMPEDMLPILVEGFHVPAPELGIAGGLAGQGLAVLQCRDFLGAQAVDHSLGQFAGLIMERQQEWELDDQPGWRRTKQAIRHYDPL